MVTYKCENKCCLIKINPYKENTTHYSYLKSNTNKKAGVFIYDPKEQRVLLVQSRGQYWGPAKGTLENGENNKDCAIREVKEETGIDIVGEQFIKATKIKNKSIYYYVEMNIENVDVQDTNGNDANGITWIKLDCLKKCINSGLIVLNQHCRIIFIRFLNIFYPKTNFVKVSKKIL